MAVALIADSHLGGAGGSAEELIAQLGGLQAAGCERLILMGDIFHVWVGNRRFETPAIRDVTARLLEMRRDGLEIDYIEGNRDFFIAGSAYAEAFSSVGAEVRLTVGSRRYLAVHGDGVDESDRQYLFWRRLSKSRLSRALMFHLPSAIAQWALDTTEAGLAQTNFKHRAGIPRQAISRYAERRLEEGHDTLLLGHFHAPHCWAVDGGEVRILDAWYNSRRIEWLDGQDAAPVVSDP